MSEASDAGSSEPESVMPGGGRAFPVQRRHKTLSSAGSVHNWWVADAKVQKGVYKAAFSCTHPARSQKTWLHFGVHGNRAGRGPLSSKAPCCPSRWSRNRHQRKPGQRRQDDAALLLVSCWLQKTGALQIQKLLVGNVDPQKIRCSCFFNV